jgi:hypothetical protein
MIEVNAVVYSFFGLSILRCATSYKPGCRPMCVPQLMHRAGIAERDIYGRSGRDLSPAKTWMTNAMIANRRSK